ncbi:MAG: DNA replication and repair protein RecF [Bacteroidales bacterium]|nr:DNA replication and repair protein RecF [Bacteroidales bacterium]MBN2763069.1 DNA replication and repair protein RecF [Bacteroidales bacterium]
MYLKNLSLVNFKNYTEAEFEFSQRINCFTGNNGVGKTNVLDAIHYLCMCKSYFNPIDTQNIRTGSEFSVIQGLFSVNDRTEEIYCAIQRMRNKVFKRNKKEYDRLSDHIGLIPVVVISPADACLITEGSDERRKFMNSVISQFDRQYLEDNIHFNHLLMQRNKLLKDVAASGRFDEETLAAYDEQIIPYAERIFDRRSNFASRLVPVFQHYYDFIAQGKENVDLCYNSQLKNGSYRDQLNEARTKDRILQYSTVGVHKDDLSLTLDNLPIKRNGSQGQQKTYLVSLKLAQFDFIKEVNNILPIFLFDDIFDKFDEKRVKQIIKLVAEDHFGQIFITHTDPERMKDILHEIGAAYKFFHIENDVVIREETNNQ